MTLRFLANSFMSSQAFCCQAPVSPAASQGQTAVNVARQPRIMVVSVS